MRLLQDFVAPVAMATSPVWLIGLICTINATRCPTIDPTSLHHAINCRHVLGNGKSVCLIVEDQGADAVVLGDCYEFGRAQWPPQVVDRPSPGEIWESVLTEKNEIFLTRKSNVCWVPPFLEKLLGTQ